VISHFPAGECTERGRPVKALRFASTATRRKECDPVLLETYSHILLDRGVEGFITIDTFIDRPLPLPAVAIPGHRRLEGVTNLVLDHRRGARLALNHLIELGHKEIAFMKGSDLSPDSEDRWKGIREVAKELGIRMRVELIVQLTGDDATPQLLSLRERAACPPTTVHGSVCLQ
jgi:LacI family transcriptional regulator